MHPFRKHSKVSGNSMIAIDNVEPICAANKYRRNRIRFFLSDILQNAVKALLRIVNIRVSIPLTHESCHSQLSDRIATPGCEFSWLKAYCLDVPLKRYPIRIRLRK